MHTRSEEYLEIRENMYSIIILKFQIMCRRLVSGSRRTRKTTLDYIIRQLRRCDNDDMINSALFARTRRHWHWQAHVGAWNYMAGDVELANRVTPVEKRKDGQILIYVG